MNVFSFFCSLWPAAGRKFHYFLVLFHMERFPWFFTEILPDAQKIPQLNVEKNTDANPLCERVTWSPTITVNTLNFNGKRTAAEIKMHVWPRIAKGNSRRKTAKSNEKNKTEVEKESQNQNRRRGRNKHNVIDASAPCIRTSPGDNTGSFVFVTDPHRLT